MVQVTSENLMQHINSGAYFKLDSDGNLKTQNPIAHFFSNLFSKKTTIENRQSAIDNKLNDLISNSCSIPNLANSKPTDRSIQKFISKFSRAGDVLIEKYLKKNFLADKIDNNYLDRQIQLYTNKHSDGFCSETRNREDVKDEINNFFSGLENIHYNNFVNNENFTKQFTNTAVDIFVHSQNTLVKNVALKMIKNMNFTNTNADLQTLETAKKIATNEPLTEGEQYRINKFLTNNFNNIISNSNEYNVEFKNTNCIKNRIIINDSTVNTGEGVMNEPEKVLNDKEKVCNTINSNIQDDALKTMISHIISPNSVDSVYTMFTRDINQKDVDVKKENVKKEDVYLKKVLNFGQQIQISKGESFNDIQWELKTKSNDENKGDKLPNLTCKCNLYLKDSNGVVIGKAKCVTTMDLNTQNNKVDNLKFSYSIEP